MNKQLDRAVPDRCVELSRRTVPCFYWMNSCRAKSCQNEWDFRVSHAADGFLYVCQLFITIRSLFTFDNIILFGGCLISDGVLVISRGILLSTGI